MRTEPSVSLQVNIAVALRAPFFQHGAYVIPRVARFGFQGRVGVDLCAKVILGFGPGLQQGGIDKRLQPPLLRLERIFNSEKTPGGNASFFRSLCRKLRQLAAKLRERNEAADKRDVTGKFEFGNGALALCGSWITGRKGEIAGFHVLGGIVKIIGGGIEGVAVLINTQIAYIEIVTRKLEVVGIAAKKGDGLFGREN